MKNMFFRFNHSVVGGKRFDVHPGLYPGLLMFNPFRIVNAGKAKSIKTTDPPSTEWFKSIGCTPFISCQIVIPYPISCMSQS